MRTSVSLSAPSAARKAFVGRQKKKGVESFFAALQSYVTKKLIPVCRLEMFSVRWHFHRLLALLLFAAKGKKSREEKPGGRLGADFTGPCKSKPNERGAEPQRILSGETWRR